MQTTINLYSLSFKDRNAFIAASIFIIGNIVLPQIFHFFPNGGIAWLPMYFFTLVGAYKYGWKVGLMTALLSPTINFVLFGMPTAQMLPIITIKLNLCYLL